jgi:proline racemase
VFADGEVDRSPTGSGVSGMAALLHADGQLAAGESVVIESITVISSGLNYAEIPPSALMPL